MGQRVVGITSSDDKEMKSASGSMSLDENAPKGGIISLDEKEIRNASGSMSLDENGPKRSIIS